LNRIQRFRGRRDVKEALANISWLSGDKIIRMLGGVIAGTAVARYLGPNQFGILNYALAIFSLFNVISNLGLDYLIIREIALRPEQEREILGTGCALKAIASVCTTAAAIGCALILSPADHRVVWIVGIVSVAAISQAVDVADFYFQANIQARRSVVPRNVVFVVASAARIIAVLVRLPLIAFGWISGLEILFAEIGIIWVYFRTKVRVPRWIFVRYWAVEMLREGWPLMLAAVMYTVYMRTDQVMLGRMSTASAAGDYAAASRLSEIWYTIPAIICNSVMPRMLRERASSMENYRKLMQQLYNFLALLSVVIAGLTTLAGPTMIRLLYGTRFAAAGSVLTVQIWSSVFVFLGTAGAGQLIHEHLTKLELQRCLLGAACNVALNWMWIPRFGVLGSAYATVCTHAVTSYFSDILNSATRPMFRMKTRALFGGGLFHARSILAARSHV
jgi:PST family polysaccharide transporter